MERAKVSSKGQITIPQRIREKYKLKPGEYVTFEEKEDGVEIKRAAVRRLDEYNEIVENIRERIKHEGIERDIVEEAIRCVRQNQQ